jgi:lipid II:glycine glycyltransferase (peptidoglycan interpeptide bridge formation enzyme)
MTNCIFEEPWFLDAVAPNNWYAVEILRNEQVHARWVYSIERKWGKKTVCNPPFVQTIGPWVLDTNAKKVNSLAREKELLNELIDKLPAGVNVDLTLDSNRQYILPFRWKGFRYEPTFSYRISDLTNLEQIYSEFRDNIKSDIRKAEKKIIIQEDLPIEVLINLQNKTFGRQKRKNPWNSSTLIRLDKACREHQAAKLLTATDNDGNIHAATYFVYDSERCYYLFGGADPEFKNSGAGCFLIWEGIKFASKHSKSFDFEGSNVEDIERVFRSFNGDFVVNYRVFKLNFWALLMDYLKPKIKKMIGYKH